MAEKGDMKKCGWQNIRMKSTVSTVLLAALSSVPVAATQETAKLAKSKPSKKNKKSKAGRRNTASKRLQNKGDGGYRKGDKVEVFSNSAQKWRKGAVLRVDDDAVTIQYKDSDGLPVHKVLALDSPNVRARNLTASEDRMVAMVYKQRQKIAAVFNEFDEDGSGTVSEEEFTMAIELLGVDVFKSPIAELTEMCTSGGRVSFVEFLRNVQPKQKPPPPGKPAPGTQSRKSTQTSERPALASVSTNS
eukprot:COSAG06_NODE_1876_length_8158_cov_2.472515_4_plen_246_part_00